MQRSLEIGVSSVLTAAAAYLFALTFTDQFDVPTFGGDVGPAFAPRGFLAVWMVLAALATLNAVRAPGAATTEALHAGQLAGVVVVTLVTGFAMVRIGFVFSTIPGFFLFCWCFGYRNIATLALVSIAAPLAIWALFTFGFELPLPHSPWFHRI